MYSLFNTQIQQTVADINKFHYNNGENKMGLARHQESLFSMAAYDMDALAQKQQEPVPPASNSAAFHPVDEYKDLSLRELLELSDDFLFEDDMGNNMNHHHHNNNIMNPLPMHAGSGGFGMRQQMSNDLSSMGGYPMSLNMPIQVSHVPSVVVSMDSSSGSSNKKRRRAVSDDEESSDDELNNDGRFRPYQAGQWSERFEDLCKYRSQMGNCLVPHTFKENLPLARWVKRQRYQYKLVKEGKASTMTPERVQALEDIGFVWDSQGAAWGERLVELRDFRKVYMHCNVPSNYSENAQLATWVKCQRRQYKLYSEGKPSNMTKERIQELESIGFEWLLRSYKKARIE